MRLNDHLVLQEITDDSVLVLMDEDQGAEIVLPLVIAARLFAGIEYFSFSNPTLAREILNAVVIRDTSGPARRQK